MNVQVTWNGSDITTSVIEYTREQDICTGEGTLDLNVEAKTARGFDPWDTIIVYEEGTKVHTYNISSIEEVIPDVMYIVTCQDDSKRLTDYFIDTQFAIDYPSSSRYWIELFLGYAGVTYNFNTSSYGNTLAETTLGATSAYDALINLLQLNGWYFYFDKDNVCQIGKLSVDASSPEETFYGDTVLHIGYLKSDKLLRNRAVVWGAGDPDTMSWIYADSSTITGWNRPGNDYRTVVYSNPAIKTFGIAYYLAFLILTEFSKTIPEKDLSVTGSYPNVEIGSYIRAITNKMTVQGMVTHITVHMSSQGLTTDYSLDQRCPRLFGYADWNDYVYIGTQGAGVWRKYIYSATWNNYSTGITDLNIKDLAAYNGLLGTISMTPNSPASGSNNPQIDSQLYVRHTSLGSWYPYSPPGFTNYYPASGLEPEYLTSGIIAEACSIDRDYGINGLVTAAYSIPGSGNWLMSGEYYAPSGNLSWVTGLTAERSPIYTQQIVITSSGYQNPADICVIDMDTNWDGQNLISVFHGKDVWEEIPQTSGIQTRSYDFGIVDGGLGVNFSDDSPEFEFSKFAGSRYVKVMVPPPNDGIALTLASGEAQSGYKLFSVTTAARETFILDDDVETDGRSYGKGLDGNGFYIEKYVFHLASGISNWYTNRKYYIGTPEDYYEQNLFDNGQIYKVSENHFTVTCLIDLLYSSEIDFWFADIFLNDETLEATYTNVKSTKVVTNQMLDPDTYFSGGTTGDNGRYYGYSYAEENGEGTMFWGGFAVLDRATGNVVSNTAPTTDYFTASQNLGGFTGSFTPNHQYFVQCTRAPYTGDDWEGFKIYGFTVDTHRGTVNTLFYQYTPPGPGTPYAWYSTKVTTPTFTTEEGQQYKKAAFSAACENPDTGNGVAHLNVTLVHTRRIWQPDLHHWVYHCFTFFDLVCNADGSLIGGRVYDDIWDETDSPPVLYTQASPDWCRGTGSLEYQTICSRYSESNPGGFNVGDGEAPRIALVDAYDQGSIVAEFETVDNYGGYSGTRRVWHICPMVDDIDQTIYTQCGPLISGWSSSESITVGYNFSGNVTKILFPGYVWGVPLHDKIIVDEGHSGSYTSTINFYIPIMLESGRLIEQTMYLVLKHSPTVSGELLPSGQFDVIYKSSHPLFVDTSKSIPTVLYDLPRGFMPPGSGISGSGGMSFTTNSSTRLAASYLNEMGSFTTIYPNSPIFDAKSFDIAGPLDFFPASGVPSGILGRYIGVAGGFRGLIMYNTDPLTNAYTPISTVISGSFIHLDFTNNFPDPYMFVSTSGIIAGSGRFLQRDSEEILWHDYSATLPSGVMITIIRADDRM